MCGDGMKKINWLLIISMIIGTLYCVIFNYDSDRLLTYLAVIPVLGMPLLLNKSKFKLNAKELCCYYVFVFMADFLGCVVNLYNTTEWYDVLVHFCSGIFSFLVGLFIVDKLDVGKVSFVFKILFCLGIMALIALGWELFEYGADCFLDLNLQHSNKTGVNDTMIDILVAFVGGILSSIGYYIRDNKKEVM